MSAYFSLNDTITALKVLRSSFVKLHRLLCSWTISTPEIEIKFVLGESVYHYAIIINEINTRLRELSIVAEINFGEIKNNLLFSNEKLDHLQRDTFALIEKLKELQSHIDPVIDGPTLKYIGNWIHILEKISGSLTYAIQILNTNEWLPDYHAGRTNPAEKLIAEKPARDGRFQYNASNGKPPANENTREFTLRVLNNAIINLEVSTVEACARLMVEFPASPWEFKMDMSRQLWDEVRHAKAFARRVNELDGQLGYEESNLDLWNMATGESLPVRLAIHQRIGEWIGVDGALWLTSVLAEKGDHETSRIIEFVSRDEMTHVGFGNKWIRQFCKAPGEVELIHNKAVSIRKKQNNNVDALHPFPINEWACELSGFTKEETKKLKEQFDKIVKVE